MDINHNEEHGGAIHVDITHKSIVHIAHDALNAIKRIQAIGIIVHGQEETGHDHDHERNPCQAKTNSFSFEVLGSESVENGLSRNIRH